MPDSKYNKHGIINPIPMTQSPKSNAGIVYQKANTPNNPGTLLPGQTISLLTFQANVSGRRIRISMNDVPAQLGIDPGQNAGSIEVISANGGFVASMGDNTDNPGTGEASINAQDLVGNPGLNVTRQSGLVTSEPLVLIFDNSSATSFPTVLIGTATVTDSHFSAPLALEGIDAVTIWVSDGTSPNGILTGVQGSLCLNGPAGQAFYCSGGTVWVGM